MSIEERLTNLENLVTSLSNKVNRMVKTDGIEKADMHRIDYDNNATSAGIEDAVCELSETVAELEQVINS